MKKLSEQQILKQVPSWDLYAKISPVVFLVATIGLWAFDVVTISTSFYIGFALFCSTMVIWWFWTIYVIRYLATVLLTAQRHLVEVKEELKIIRQDINNLDK